MHKVKTAMMPGEYASGHASISREKSNVRKDTINLAGKNKDEIKKVLKEIASKSSKLANKLTTTVLNEAAGRVLSMNLTVINPEVLNNIIEEAMMGPSKSREPSLSNLKIFYKLTKLANYLDAKGLTKEADYVYKIIKVTNKH